MVFNGDLVKISVCFHGDFMGAEWDLLRFHDDWDMFEICLDTLGMQRDILYFLCDFIGLNNIR